MAIWLTCADSEPATKGEKLRSGRKPSLGLLNQVSTLPAYTIDMKDAIADYGNT